MKYQKVDMKQDDVGAGWHATEEGHTVRIYKYNTHITVGRH